MNDLTDATDELVERVARRVIYQLNGQTRDAHRSEARRLLREGIREAHQSAIRQWARRWYHKLKRFASGY